MHTVYMCRRHPAGPKRRHLGTILRDCWATEPRTTHQLWQTRLPPGATFAQRAPRFPRQDVSGKPRRPATSSDKKRGTAVHTSERTQADPAVQCHGRLSDPKGCRRQLLPNATKCPRTSVSSTRRVTSTIGSCEIIVGQASATCITRH